MDKPAQHADPVHGVVGSAFVDGLIWATGGGNNIGGSSGTQFNQVYRPALPVISIGSRKPHGTTGPFEISLEGATLGVECRSSGGNHTIVFRFVHALSSVGGVSFSGAGSVSSSGVGAEPSEYVVNLAETGNAQVVHVSLTNVTDTAGNQSDNITVSMGVLIGDTNGDGFVNSGDATQTRNRSGQATDATNFRSDYNTDGVVNAGDATTVRARSGTSISQAFGSEESKTGQ
jgi:hypothetical protein